MTHVIVGKVVPYSQRTRCPVADGFYEQVEPGAFSSAALEARGTVLRVHHDRRRTVEGALRLINGFAGVYVYARVQDSPLVRDLLSVGFVGMSVCWHWATKQDQAVTDFQSITRHVTHVDWLDDVSLVTEGVPAYVDTWAIVGHARGLQRVKQEEEATRVARFGTDYRRSVAKEWWEPRVQAPRLEERLQALDPWRSYRRRNGYVGLW